MPKLPLDKKGLVLYGNILSPITVNVAALYNHFKIDFERYELDFANKEHKSKLYLENINFRGQMPAIKDGDYTLFEGLLLMKYISKSFSIALLNPSHKASLHYQSLNFYSKLVYMY